MTGLIGIIGNRPRVPEFQESFDRLYKPRDFDITRQVGNSPARARNDIIRAAIKLEKDYVLFLDDDQVLAPDTLMRLLNRGVDIVSALYTWRTPPFHPVVFESLQVGSHKEMERGLLSIKKFSNLPPGLTTVKYVGAGCLLCKTTALLKMIEPWFTLGRPFSEEWCDDISFCLNAMDSKIPIHLDLEAPIGHVASAICTPFYDEKTKSWKTGISIEDSVISVIEHQYETELAEK